MTDPANHSNKPAEFDAFATDYSGGMDNSVKALLGSSGDSFLDVKLNWLRRHVFPAGTRADLRLLDYGCGRGDMLRLMARRGLKLQMLGSDVSDGMLREGAKLWAPELGALPHFMQQAESNVPLADAAVDVVLISSVLHHIPVADRPGVYREIWRLLKPGGRVVVFEHNPLNPVTKYVVTHTPIDENAILLRCGEVEAGLRDAGFAKVTPSYLMFAPPRLGSIGQHIDAMLSWLPIGAQYAVLASKIN